MPNLSSSYYLVLDQGTSATKVFLFNEQHDLCYTARRKLHLHRPAPHHVEGDPLAIVQTCYHLLQKAWEYSRTKGGSIRAVGLAVQRSTFLFWDKRTIKPLTPALSWQDSRAKAEVTALKGHGDAVQERTGVPLSAHFGAPKYLHLIRHDPSLQCKIKEGNAWFGPLSAFLLHSLTGQVCVEPTIANRSLLLNLKTRAWDPELCHLFRVPETCLPPLVPSLGSFGTVQVNSEEWPVLCVLGDQQAALVGQGGRQPGSIAMNFGTSGSVQMNTGPDPVILKGLISSPLLTSGTDGEYMLEGTINACNALFYWLESELAISHRQMQWDKRCAKTETDGVYLPGFVGLASPYWKDNLKTSTLGLERAGKDEIVRAAMESIGFLVYDILELMKRHRHFGEAVLVASGGGARPPLLQFIADLVQIPIGHTPMKDCTAFGIYRLLRERLGEPTPPKPPCDHVYLPNIEAKKRRTKIERWKQLLKEREIKLL